MGLDLPETRVSKHLTALLETPHHEQAVFLREIVSKATFSVWVFLVPSLPGEPNLRIKGFGWIIENHSLRSAFQTFTPLIRG